MLLLKQMMILFFVMLVGWIARRQGIIDEHAGKKLSSIVVNIANPAEELLHILFFPLLLVCGSFNPGGLSSQGFAD